MKNNQPFIKMNIELLFGIIIIITHASIWFVPAYYVRNLDIKEYKFLSLFPMWFVYSSLGSFFVVVCLIIIYIIFIK